MEIKQNNLDILICECSSREHQIIIEYNREENLAHCSIRLLRFGFFKRLIMGIKYIFGYKCRYGNFEEFIISPKHSERLRALSALLVIK